MQRLAIDYGKARVGVSMGAKMAREYTTLPNDGHLVSKLKAIIQQEDVSEVIVGDSLRTSGEAGTLHNEIQRFITELESLVPNIVVECVNEAFSTTQAEIELREQGLGYEEIRKRIDQYAAKIILDQYNADNPPEAI